MKIAIINGPNLNLLGKRETTIYGNQSFDSYFKSLCERYPNITFTYFQSNIEGVLVDKLQELGFSADGIILNAGAYTHTSVAIGDCIAAIESPVIELHISNVYAREEFRHQSYLSAVCKAIIAGAGLDGYRLGVEYFLEKNS